MCHIYKNLLLLLSLLSSVSHTYAMQPSNRYQVRTVAFYNVENLFDCTDDLTTRDDDRTPNGKDQWTEPRYHLKLEHIAHVLSQIGTSITGSTPDLIGLCEIENRAVLNDLIKKDKLLYANYGIIHLDSPDERGIDVALLYKKSAFIPSDFKSHRLLIFNAEGYRDFTRDQLVVTGFLDGEKLSLIINHWPSRSGGVTKSSILRIAAAQLNKRIIDSLMQWDSTAKIISMGDLNDNPRDPSLKKVLRTTFRAQTTDTFHLFNPMERLFKKGVGSLAYRDQWHLFDQILVNNNLTPSQTQGYRLWQAQVFAPKFLTTRKGRYKGYPFRTYAGGTYTGGYSDHFPVFAFLIREASTE